MILPEKLTKAADSACRWVLGVALFFTLMSGSVSAYEVRTVGMTQYVLNDSGEAVFQLKYYNPGSGNFSQGQSSTRAFTQQEMDAVAEAAGYWTDVTKSTGKMPGTGSVTITDDNGNTFVVNGQPVVINVGTISDNNAWGNTLDGMTSANPLDPYLVSATTALLADGTAVNPATVTQNDGAYHPQAHGIMAIGLGFSTTPTPPSQVGRAAGDLTTIAIHEFGHILGISSTMEVDHIDNDRWTIIYRFPDELNRWQAHLRDNNGHTAVPGGYPNNGVTGKPVDDDPTNGNKYIFDMGDPDSLTQPARFTFVGTNVMEVYYDGNTELIRTKTNAGIGVPLQGLVLSPYRNFAGADRWWYNNPNTMSHFNTRNTTMSWQMYRNYPMFLEVELAAMKDMGYDIDLRNFFGRSFYVDGDGETVVYNDRGFWNWSDNGYSVGTPNTTTFGVGLHLFANQLNVVQRGNIRADGEGAAGIRVDGVGNTLTVDKGTTVTALGENGIGLLVAYGKNHHIINRGTIKVSADLDYPGTAVRFDFGESNVGALLGSYAYDPYYGYMEEGNMSGGFPTDLQGPLVKTFDVNGKILGTPFQSGRPVIIQGNYDRIIARGDYAGTDKRYDGTIFNPDTHTGDIFRIFDNGALMIPDDPRFWQGRPIIQADGTFIRDPNPPPNVANYKRRGSEVIINPRDGSTILIFDKSENRTQPIDPDIISGHVLRVDDYLYMPNPEVYNVEVTTDYDDEGIVIRYTVKLRHVVYDIQNGNGEPSIIIIVDGNDKDPESLARYRTDPNGYYVTVLFPKDDPDDNNAAGNYLRYTEGWNYKLNPTGYYDPTKPDLTVVLTDANGNFQRVVTDPDPDLALHQAIVGVDLVRDNNGNILRDNQGEAVIDTHTGTANSDNLVPGNLDDFIIQYDNDPRGDGHIFLLRKLDHPYYDPNKPWTRYVTADQDEVIIPFVGGAIYIGGPKYDPDASSALGVHVEQGGSHVETINVMRDSVIEGDIVTHYKDPTINYATSKDRGTTLTFGMKPDSAGRATSTPDADFHFVFRDNINYYEYFERAYINDRPGFTDYARWGDYDFNEETGAYEFVGFGVAGERPRDRWLGLGRFLQIAGDSFNVDMVGRFDLQFKGGYTEFRPGNSTKYHRYNVNSVAIDTGATFSMSIGLAQDADGTITTMFPEMYVAKEFTNNGRLSGEGTIWVGAKQFKDLTEIDESGTPVYTGIGFTADGTLMNSGTISPGPNNGLGEEDQYLGATIIPGRRTGTLGIGGNLDLSSSSSVYEVTISADKAGPEYHWTTDSYTGVQKFEIEETWSTDPITGVKTLDKKQTFDSWTLGDSDQLVVSGITKLGGTLRINVTPGNYDTDPTVYTIIRSEGGYIEGTNFENYEHYIGFLTFEPYYLNASKTYVSPFDSRDLQFTVIRDPEYFKKHGRTYNEISVATAIDHSLFDSYEVAFALGHKDNTDADLRGAYNQIGAHIRANSALLNLWSPSETVFRRIGYGNGQMETGNRGRVNWQRICGKTSKMLGQEAARMRTGSLWADALHTSFTAEGDYDGNSSDYRFSRTGMMIGAEMNLTPYSALGAVAAYNLGNMRQWTDKVDSNDYVLGAYFVCAPFNEFEFKAYLGLGFQDYKMERNIYQDGIISTTTGLPSGIGPERYKSDFVGNTFNVSLELARPLMLHPTFILRPTLGIDTQYLWQNGPTEDATTIGSGIYALSFQKMEYHRSLFRAGFSSETSGVRGGIRMRAFYVAQFDGENFPDFNARFAKGGSDFNIRGVDLGDSFLNLGIGANIWLDGEKTSSLFFDYDSEIYGTSKKTLSNSVQFGYLQNF